jgi:hypothetical protein
MIVLMKAKILMAKATIIFESDSKYFLNIDSCSSCQPPKMNPKRIALGITQFAPEIPGNN